MQPIQTTEKHHNDGHNSKFSISSFQVYLYLNIFPADADYWRPDKKHHLYFELSDAT